MRALIVLCAAAAVALLASASSRAQPAELDRRTVRAIERLEAVVPERYFDEAYGYAVLPAVKRLGLGLGAAWGRGTLVEQGRVVPGRARFWQATSGIQAGGMLVSLIVFFRDRDAMEAFRCNTTEFMGQAGLSIGPVGLLKTPAYRAGVAVFAAHRFGLMNEATISIGKVSFHPLDARDRPACSASDASADAAVRRAEASDQRIDAKLTRRPRETMRASGLAALAGAGRIE